MKIILTLLLSLTLFLISACGTRVPFVAKKPLSDAALVYIYITNEIASDESSTSDPYYLVRINNKRVDGKIRSGEYMSFDLKPQAIKISTTRDALVEHTLNLELKSGETYYLKVRGNLDNDAFEFIKVSSEIGLKEIIKTGLAGSTAVEEDSIITAFVSSDEDKEVETSQKLSKSDEIKKAYKMKAEGMITQEEYEKLKAEILAK